MVIHKSSARFLGTQILLIVGQETELIRTGIFPKQNALSLVMGIKDIPGVKLRLQGLEFF